MVTVVDKRIGHLDQAWLWVKAIGFLEITFGCKRLTLGHVILRSLNRLRQREWKVLGHFRKSDNLGVRIPPTGLDDPAVMG